MKHTVLLLMYLAFYIHAQSMMLDVFLLLKRPNNKLDGVSLVDNRPSTNKLHHFVKKKKKLHVTKVFVEQTRVHRVC